MTDTTNATLVGVFEDYGRAKAALDELIHAGFPPDQLGVVTLGGGHPSVRTPEERKEEHAGTGAVAGAVTGGTLGTVAGALAVGLIPGVGPALTGGLLMGVVLGGATGAALGSYLGPFVALGFSHEQAEQFGSDLRAGRTVVTVKAGERAAEAYTILQAHGAEHGNLAEFAYSHAPHYTHLQS
jgi:hypothetical protein